MLQRSVDNIRFKAIQAKVNLESEIFYNNQTIGSPIENKPNYYKTLGENYQLTHQKKNEIVII